jgi:hypothetical protein
MNALKFSLLTLCLTALTNCLPPELEPPQVCTDMGMPMPGSSGMSTDVYYSSDNILVQIPMVTPANFRITSSLGSIHDTCDIRASIGISITDDYNEDTLSFTEYQSYGVNLPDKVTYKIEDLGDCADVSDDHVVAEFKDLSLFWFDYQDEDACYGTSISRRAYVYVYDMP